MRSKKYLPTLFLLLVNLTIGWGQAAAPAAGAAPKTGQLPEIMTTVFFIALAVLFTVSLLVLFKANSLLMRRLIRLEAEKSGLTLPEALSGLAPAGDDFFTRLRKRFWENPEPRELEGEIMFHHDYDGIRELDNHLPPWWVNLFAITVVWAIGYMYFYHWGGSGLNQADQYKKDVEVAKKEIAAALVGKANAVDESSVTALADATALSDGGVIFTGKCAACHGQKGEGLVGPNLTDEYWLHGGGIKNVFKTIKYGVPEKGMISWSSQMTPSEMQKVASYILTLKGTNPPNPKEPQGDIWKEEGAVVQQDTTQAVEKKG